MQLFRHAKYRKGREPDLHGGRPYDSSWGVVSFLFFSFPFLLSFQSFHYAKYRKEENQIYIVADDITPRWLTSTLHLDFDTMAGGDKFGNIFLVRLPQVGGPCILPPPPTCPWCAPVVPRVGQGWVAPALPLTSPFRAPHSAAERTQYCNGTTHVN